MVVIVYRKEIVFGKECLLPTYLPAGTIPTPKLQETAKELDKEIRTIVASINADYSTESKKFVKSMDKWRWLGSRLELLLKSLRLLEKTDIENNSIWPAISQYLQPDLMRGFDAKRSGTTKDHLKKVWLLASLPNTDWFNTWTGWDAFIDRGESLVGDPRVFKSFKDQLSSRSFDFNKDEYQSLARFFVETLSSRKGNAVNFALLTDKEIQQAVEQAINKTLQANK